VKYRWTLVLDIPVSAAIERILQWVDPSFGLVFNVALIIAATRSSDIDRGAPGRSPSYSPVILKSIKRCRHFSTVACERGLDASIVCPSGIADPGESYVLANDCVSMREMFRLISAASGTEEVKTIPPLLLRDLQSRERSNTAPRVLRINTLL
jgi:hypothetical protein